MGPTMVAIGGEFKKAFGKGNKFKPATALGARGGVLNLRGQMRTARNTAQSQPKTPLPPLAYKPT